MSSWELVHRPTNNWGMGDLPAPWAVGDLVTVYANAPVFAGIDAWRPRSRNSIQPGPATVYVCDAFSVDEGDAWYFRLSTGHITRRGNFVQDGDRTDRLHVAWRDRSTWDGPVNWMDGVTLIETQDPEGLALRKQMLVGGWTFEETPTCDCCGHPLPRMTS